MIYDLTIVSAERSKTTIPTAEYANSVVVGLQYIILFSFVFASRRAHDFSSSDIKHVGRTGRIPVVLYYNIIMSQCPV